MNKDGSVDVNPNISAKITGFACAELFKIEKKKSTSESFKCDKEASIFQDVEYQSPQILNEDVYDARKADIWALGMMLIHCLLGAPLYDTILHEPKKGSAFWSIMARRLNEYLDKQGLIKHFNSKILSLLNGLLAPNETYRLQSAEILKHQWFNSYYSKYKRKLVQRSAMQKKKGRNSRSKKNIYPFYIYNKY